MKYLKLNFIFDIFQPSDDENRIEEALVRIFVSQICQNLPKNHLNKILNPNEVSVDFIYYTLL